MSNNIMLYGQASQGVFGRPVSVLLTVFLLFWFVFMPKGHTSVQYVTFLIIAATGIVILFSYQEAGIGSKGRNVFFLLLCYMLVYAASFLVNYESIRAGSIFELFRALYILGIFFTGYFLQITVDSKKVKAILLNISKSILIISLLVGLAQLFNPDVFNIIWLSDKTEGLEGTIRITGTMYNPNSFAVLIAFLALVISAIGGLYQQKIWALLGLGLIILSGSRTVFVAYIASMIFLGFYVSIVYFNVRYVFGFVGIVLFLGFSFAGALFYIPEKLPYMSQMASIIIEGDLRSVNSLNARFLHLEKIYEIWINSPLSNILFGVGSIPKLQAGDNEFVSVLFRLGWIGLFLFLLIYAYAIRVFWAVRHSWEGLLLGSIIVLSLVSGLTQEVLSSWMWPIYWMLVFGLACGKSDYHKRLKYSAYNTYL